MADYHLTSAAPAPSASLLDKATFFQELLIRHATGSREDDDLYRELRRDLIQRGSHSNLVPTFVRDCRTLSGFWSWIKNQSGQWEPRRAIIRESFADLLDHLEGGSGYPADLDITKALSSFDEGGVALAWSKALERRQDDPEGAITSARTVLEAICKRILDDAEVTYDDTADLPKLYGMAASSLELAPDAHTEQVFRSILGGCQNIVNSLGTLRNRLGDAHGKGRKRARPLPRHAALAVNLAGSMGLFLVETNIARQEQRNMRQLKLQDPRFVDDLLSRICISEIVKGRVQLKKAGREWRGLSPFASESSPSFYVNDAKKFFHCFNTGKHGTAIDFLVEIEGMTKIEATEKLAKQIGLSVDTWAGED